jgi:hypothetical protein
MPDKPNPTKEFYDLCKSFIGAAMCEVILAVGHMVGTHVTAIGALLLTWIAAHVTLKVF